MAVAAGDAGRPLTPVGAISPHYFCVLLCLVPLVSRELTGGHGNQQHRARARQLRGRIRLAGRLRSPDRRRLPGSRRAEPHPFPRRRRRRHPPGSRPPRRPGRAGRPFLRRSRHHRGRYHPQIAALVYIAAFAPDTGEPVGSLIADPPPGAPVPPILPPVNGLLFLDRDKFAAAFAADVPEKVAAFMADAQVPAGAEALGGAVTEPAWRGKPSWYLVATDDQMIPPAAQRAMGERAKATVTETPGSHAVLVSRPAVVAAVISQAAQA